MLVLEDLRTTVERLTTELDVAQVREQDVLRKAGDSTNELESMKRHVNSLEEQLQLQVKQVR
jgi:uncharacterized protein YifE (UPF0438 family)